MEFSVLKLREKAESIQMSAYSKSHIVWIVLLGILVILLHRCVVQYRINSTRGTAEEETRSDTRDELTRQSNNSVGNSNLSEIEKEARMKLIMSMIIQKVCRSPMIFNPHTKEFLHLKIHE